MKTIGILLFLFCAAFGVNAQISRFRQVNENNRLVIESTSSGTARRGKCKGSSIVAEKADTLLYANVVRQYSWYVGQGKSLTKDEADHLPFYFRLTMRNASGHFQHIEAMHGDTLTRNHNQSNYILDTDYDLRDENRHWCEKFATIAQWFLTPDLSGDVLAEERAYDNDGNMIYGFVPIRNSANSVVCSYTDDWGFPIDVDEDDNYTYGNVIMITYSAQGCDSIIDFLDGAGLRRLNNDGVDQQRYVYDCQMRTVMRTSNNCVGDYMIDNWGNCGATVVYDDANHKYTITNIDKELKPMRMPGGRADEEHTYIRCDVYLDEWGRRAKVVFLDAEGNQDETLAGIQQIVYNYSDKGVLLSRDIIYNGNNIVRRRIAL